MLGFSVTGVMFSTPEKRYSYDPCAGCFHTLCHSILLTPLELGGNVSVSHMKALRFRDVSFSEVTVVINGRAGTGQVI